MLTILSIYTAQVVPLTEFWWHIHTEWMPGVRLRHFSTTILSPFTLGVNIRAGIQYLCWSLFTLGVNVCAGIQYLCWSLSILGVNVRAGIQYLCWSLSILGVNVCAGIQYLCCKCSPECQLTWSGLSSSGLSPDPSMWVYQHASASSSMHPPSRPCIVRGWRDTGPWCHQVWSLANQGRLRAGTTWHWDFAAESASCLGLTVGLEGKEGRVQVYYRSTYCTQPPLLSSVAFNCQRRS